MSVGADVVVGGDGGVCVCVVCVCVDLLLIDLMLLSPEESTQRNTQLVSGGGWDMTMP